MILGAGPGGGALAGAGPLQQVAVGPPPLPGGVAAVLRFFFNVPSWFQIAGFVVGLALACVVVWLAWRSRTLIVRWVVSRPRGVRIALGAVAAAVVLAFAGVGAFGYHYMESNNGFCTGCHVMNAPFQRFAGSKHDSLSCHACHQQSMFANVRQLYLWVAERPQAIGKHAKVPTPVCAGCHVQGAAKETWQRIASTAGHRTHLQSDSSALKNVQCVTCHGLEVHRFVPVDSTCAQSGCHVTIEIKLAKMRGQTDLHCVLCHRFTAEVPVLATYDSARATLGPGMKQCFACHAMQAALASFDPARDPHRGNCGACHNPHTQTSRAEAAATCTSAKCHVGWRADPFHVGRNHRAVSTDCTLCHQPHAAKVDASDCAGCHAAVRARRVGGRRLNPPLPFDTTKALRRVSSLGPRDASGPTPDAGAGPFFDEPPAGRPPHGGTAAARDTFPHERHKRLSCVTCHTSARGHGQLTFQVPRGCQICHHQAPQTSECMTCHQPAELAAPDSVVVRVTMSGQPPRAHPARFDHTTHRRLKCVACHTTPATLAPAPEVAACSACHDDHHAAARPCALCHQGEGPALRAAHAPPAEAHVGCDRCHARAIVARLVPDRQLCVMCHPKQNAHYPARECTLCHFGASPDAFRRHLETRGGGS